MTIHQFIARNFPKRKIEIEFTIENGQTAWRHLLAEMRTIINHMAGILLSAEADDHNGPSSGWARAKTTKKLFISGTAKYKNEKY